jgi:quercetin dioxygenase-like cupin family protein
MQVSTTSDMARLHGRIVKYADLRPCFDAFIDTRTPGSDQKENFTIIGPGVSENPNQFVHIAEPHGFNIGGARQPPGCTNSQHSHETVEVFYVHSGHWRFDLGEHGQDAQAILSPGDLISIPTHVFRGFSNIGKETGFLWAVLGGDDPGHVLWAPKVFDLARDYGLVLLDDGMLIDTSRGESVPEGRRLMPVTSREQIESLQTLSSEQLESCISRSGMNGPAGPFDKHDGARETLLVGSGRMNWSHGFTISEIRLKPGAVIPSHRLNVADVWFIQTGKLVLSIDGETSIAGAGDTITIPVGASRALRNTAAEPVTFVAVRGGDQYPDVHWS